MPNICLWKNKYKNHEYVKKFNYYYKKLDLLYVDWVIMTSVTIIELKI